jgi:hypothetical protein
MNLNGISIDATLGRQEAAKAALCRQKGRQKIKSPGNKKALLPRRHSYEPSVLRIAAKQPN